MLDIPSFEMGRQRGYELQGVNVTSGHLGSLVWLLDAREDLQIRGFSYLLGFYEGWKP